MSKAAFFDRDGVLNFEVGDYIQRFEDFKPLPHLFVPLKKLFDAGYLLFVITNQGGLAKKLYTRLELEKMHAFLQEKAKEEGFFFTEMYYCPHHPESSACLCRKPGSLMVEKAIAKYNVTTDGSFMIGDKERDVVCANGAGIKGYLIEANEDFTAIVEKEISINHS